MTAIEVPIFEIYNNPEHPYTEIDLISDVVWFLASYQPDKENFQSKANLSKAHFASQNGVFKYNSRNAPSEFRKKWHDYGAASAFYYVEKHHQGVEFFVDPSSPTFNEEIDDLLSDPLRLRTHLSKCRTVVELLRVKLHPRALSAIRLPEFPLDLEPMPVTHPTLPNETKAIFKGYAKLQNSFRDSEIDDN